MADLAPPTPMPLDRPAIHVDVEPGGEIILRGALHSTYDGSIVDAATTTWPPDAPGGASIDAGGLYDLEAGGFHVVSRDPVRHEVHAIATSDAAPACSTLGVAAPCLPIRLHRQALSRLLTIDAWASSLEHGGGQITLEPAIPPPFAPPAAAVPYLSIAAGLAIAVVASIAGVRWRRRRAASPEGRLAALVARVRGKLDGADVVLAAPLAPALEASMRSLKERRIEAASSEGQRVAAVLLRVEEKLDASVHAARSAAEQRAADEVVREVESALEAADEVAAPLEEAWKAADRAGTHSA